MNTERISGLTWERIMEEPAFSAYLPPGVLQYILMQLCILDPLKLYLNIQLLRLNLHLN